MNNLAKFTPEEQEILVQFSPEDLMPAGLENLKPGDTGMPPRLVISQPNRPIAIPNVDTAGKIVNTVTGEVYDSLQIVVLMFMNDTRVMWPLAFSADNVPECISDNGETPTINEYRKVTNPQYGERCLSCQFSQFGEKSEKPRCSIQRNFLMWIVDAAEPAIFTAQSTGLKSVRQLTTLARTKGLMTSIVITTREVKEARGNWFVPVFAAGDRLNAATIAEVVTAKNELQNLVAAAATEIRNGEDDDVTGYDPEEVPF